MPPEISKTIVKCEGTLIVSFIDEWHGQGRLLGNQRYKVNVCGGIFEAASARSARIVDPRASRWYAEKKVEVPIQ